MGAPTQSAPGSCDVGGSRVPAELDARCCPTRVLQHPLGDIPRNDSEECLPRKPGKFKNGGNFRVSYQLSKQPPLQETTLRCERFLRLSWQIKGLRETCECLKGTGAGGRTGNSSCSGQGCSAQSIIQLSHGVLCFKHKGR